MSVEHSTPEWIPFPPKLGKDGFPVQSRGWRYEAKGKLITVYGTGKVEISVGENGSRKIIQLGGLSLLDSYMTNDESMLVKILADHEEKAPTEPPWF